MTRHSSGRGAENHLIRLSQAKRERASYSQEVRERERERRQTEQRGLRLIAVVLPRRPFAIKNPARPSSRALSGFQAALPLSAIPTYYTMPRRSGCNTCSQPTITIYRRQVDLGTTKIIRNTCAMQRAESPSLAIRMLRRCCIRRSISKQRRMTAHSDGKSEARKLDAFSRKTRLELSDIRYLPRYNGFPLSCGMVFIFRRIERVSGGWILEIDDLIL